MQKNNLEQDIRRLLFGQLQALGLFDQAGFTLESLKSKIGGPEYHQRWLKRALPYLVDAGYLRFDSGSYTVVHTQPMQMQTLWTRWTQMKAQWADDINQTAQLNLIEVMLRALPQILAGDLPATDVMFPNSSMALVEGVYSGNPVSDYFNDVVAQTVTAYVESRLEDQPDVKIRILEVGAGTGGTTTGILEQLQPFKNHVESYVYTDLSHAFLMHAESNFVPENPYIRTAIFDLEQPPQTQDMPVGHFDLVIATNVLHATKNIRDTLQNVKTVLHKHGLLIMNEICTHSLFGHLTFGLLKGWWLFEDADIRIPGSPALYPEAWHRVLDEEGFPAVHFPAESAHHLGQQVVIAESDGQIRFWEPDKTTVTKVQQPVPPKTTATEDAAAKGDRAALVRRTIVNNIAKSLKMAPDEVDPNEPFADFGIDSITGVNLVTLINEDLGIEMETTALFDFASVKRLTRHILDQYHLTIPTKPQTPEPPRREAAAVSAPAPAPQAAQREPVAVIGMSGRFAQSNSVHDLWQHLIKGHDLIQEASRWDTLQPPPADDSDSPRHYGSFVDDIDLFDPLFFSISGIEATYMDPQQRLFLEEAWRAMEDAGYAGSSTAGSNYGIYVGCTVSSYQTLLDENPPPQAFWGNAASVVPARLAYYLDLQGPAITVDTACSSSLVAIHMACMALWNHEIEAAVAGGVCVQSTPSFYQAASPAGMLSATGKCHTFDDRADGFVPGEAVGALILKRLSDAIAMGDHMYGVIRGSGLNQDGATNGITAPSALSQERVERYVYDTFDINPDTIQMVEAHGTGTILGDPIEYRALTRAFRKDTDRTHFCALGSVKTNLGHTLGAAGVTGMIKVLLSLSHRQIPPSLHYQSGNKHIKFEGSPFFVNTQRRDWDPGANGVRRAAVSSFGFSGTNAHVVVDEAPANHRSHPANPAWLLVLSARTRSQLQQQVNGLKAHLQTNPAVDIGNMSFTLMVGRKHFDHRLALVVRDGDNIVELLETWETTLSNRIFTAQVKERLLTDQDRANGQAALNQAIASNHTDYAELLGTVAKTYVMGHELDYAALFAGDYSRISLPTYPFERQRYWISPTPAAQPVTQVQNQAVLHPLVHTNNSTLSQQRFSATFTGAEQCLKDHVVEGGKMLPGVAHMEMAHAALQAAVDSPAGFKLRNVVWLRPILQDQDPETVHISLTPNDRGIAYQLYADSPTNEPMVFSQGTAQQTDKPSQPVLDLQALRSQCNRAQLTPQHCYDALTWMGFQYGPSLQCIQEVHVGDGQVLAKLQLPQVAQQDFDRFSLHPSLMDASLQAAIGLKIDPALLQGKAALDEERAISPSIPFALKELEILAKFPRELYVWVRATGDPHAQNPPLDLDLCDASGKVCVRMRGFMSRPLSGAEAPTQSENGVLWMQPEWIDSRREPQTEADTAYSTKLVLTLDVPQPQSQAGLQTAALAAQSADTNQGFSTQRYTQAVAQAIQHIQTLIRAGSGGRSLIQIVVNETRSPQHQLYAGLFGLLQTARLEHNKLVTQLILVDRTDSDFINRALSESADYPDQVIIRYRDSGRFIHRWHEYTPPAQAALPWREGGVYAITGGLGGLGLIFARSMAAQIRNARIVLLGRSALTPEKSSILQELQTNQTQVSYLQMDVSNLDQVRAAMDQIQATHGTLNGIIHGAGVIFDRYLVDKPADEVYKVLAAKVTGTENLDLATAHIRLDCFIMFSSMAGAIGNTGQCDYASANAFMGAYAGYRRELTAKGQRWGQTIALDWPLWKDGGMTLDEATKARMRKYLGMFPMESDTGIQALYQAIAADQSRLMVIEGNLPRLRGNFFPDKTKVKAEAKPMPTPQADAKGLRLKLEQALSSMIADLVQVPESEVDTDTEFQKYGFDSILFSNLSTLLNETFDLDLLPTIFFEYTTIHQLAAHLITTSPEELKPHLEITEEPSPTAAIHAPQAAPESKPAYRFQSREAQPKPVGDEPVAIIGMSGRFPMADDINAFWDNLVQGRDCISEIPPDRWDWRAFYGDPAREANKCNVKWGGFMDGVGDFDPLFFGISPREAEMMDPQQRLLMTYVWLAIEDAGYAPETLAGRNIGILVGTGNSGYGRLMANGAVDIEVNSTTGMVPSVGPNRMSFLLDFHGPSEPIETACSSSLVAIHRAVLAMNTGNCDMAVVGGVNTLITPEAHISFNKAGMLCEDGRCKTFSNQANGFVRGEGVGMIFLKRLSEAEADHDHIYGLIRGTAMNHGGRAGSLTAPNPKAQAELLKTVYRKAGIDPRTVGYIEAHGTGTELGDPIEINGLKAAFQALYEDVDHTQSPQPHCGLGSVKTNIGHLELSAGIAGVIKVLLQMKHQTLVKSLHCDTVNPYVRLEDTPFYIVNDKKPWHPLNDARGGPVPLRAGVSSFGIGGVNAHVVLEAWNPPPATQAQAAQSQPALIVLSAANPDRLRVYINNLAAWLRKQSTDLQAGPVSITNLAYTLQVGRQAMASRFAVEARDPDALLHMLERFLDAETHHNPPWRQGRVKRRDKRRDDAAALIDNCISEARYDKILDLWIEGVEVDWLKLYPTHKPHRLSLPTYPFPAERHWVPVNPTETPSVNPAQSLVYRDISTPELTQFSTTLTGAEFFLSDHIMGARKTLPGVAYLEMVRAAAQLSAKPVHGLSHITWQRPFVIEDSPGDIRTLIHTDTDKSRFEIRSRDSRGEDVVHCNGRLHLDSAPQTAPVIDIPTKINQSTSQISGEAFYAPFKGETWLGPGMRGITHIYRNQNRAVAQINLPPVLADQSNPFELHPAVMDVAFQLATRLVLEHQLIGRYLPFFLKSLTIYGPTPNSGYAVAQPEPHPEKDSTARYRVDITDKSGRVAVSFEGFTSRDVTAANTLYLTSTRQPVAVNADQTSRRTTVLLTPDISPAQAQAVERKFNAIHLDYPKAAGMDTTACFTAVANHLKSVLQSKPQEAERLLLPVPGGADFTAFAPLAGLFKSLLHEDRLLQAQLLVIDHLPQRDPHDLVHLLSREATAEMHSPEVFYNPDNQRQLPRLIEVKNPGPASPRHVLKTGGVYWITGGLGSIGRIITQYAARVPDITLVLSGRREASPAITQELTAQFGPKTRIHYLSVDISQADQVNTAVQHINRQFGSLSGVFHCAGLIRDSLIVNKTDADIQAVFAPKVTGLHNLDQATRDQPLDFMVLFSSLAAVFGNRGQSDYAGANAYLDAFAHQRNRQQAAGSRNGRTVSINWPLWAEGGMQPGDAAVSAMLEGQGMIPMLSSTAITAVFTALALQQSNLMVLEGDTRKLRQTYLSDSQPTNPPRQAAEPPRPVVAPATAHTHTRDVLKRFASKMLKIDLDQIQDDVELVDYGFDSITMTDFANQLAIHYDLDLTVTDFFEHGTIEDLAVYLVQEHPDVFAPAKSATPQTDVVQPTGPAVTQPTQPIPPVSTQSDRDDMAVIGISAAFPKAADAQSFWRNIRDGVDCIDEIPAQRWDWRQFHGEPKDNRTHIKWGGFIDGIGDFDPLFFKISPREAEQMDPQQRLLMTHTWRALEDAAIPPKSLRHKPTGVFVACAGVAEYGNMLNASNNAMAMGSAATTFIPTRISHALNLTGPSEYCDTACSSALVALHRAGLALDRGECEQAVIGAVNLLLSPMSFVGFEAMSFLSPNGRAKSFQDGSDGYVRSEGVAVLIVKPLRTAQRDRDPIYALVKGTGVAHGGKGMSLTAANATGMKAAMNQAFDRAAVDPRTITHMEAHGIATAAADSVEINALKSGYAKLESRFEPQVAAPATCYISSLKPVIGHGELVSGMAALIKTIFALRNRCIPGLPGFETLNPDISLANSRFQISAHNQEWEPLLDLAGRPIPRRAAINSYGFSGVNAHVILEDYQPAQPELEAQSEHLFLLSAAKPHVLRTMAQNLIHFLEQHPQTALADMAHTLQVGREHMAERVAVRAANHQELILALTAFLNNQLDPSQGLQGQAAGTGRTMNLLADDEDSRTMIGQWLAKRKLNKIAALWVDGYALDWPNLQQAAGRKPRRISLPTQPFSQKRYWAAVKPGTVTAATNQPHPLLQRNSSISAAFETTLSGQEFFMRDHVVRGEKRLPGVVYLEMVRAAFETVNPAGGVIQIEDHRWLTPYIQGLSDPDLHVRLQPGADRSHTNYQVFSLDPTGLETHHAAGTLTRQKVQTPPSRLDHILAQPIKSHLDMDQLYAAFQAMGIHYGPSFKALTEVRLLADCVLARITSDQAAADPQLVLHPAVLDAALQAAFGLNHASPGDDLTALAGRMGAFQAAGMDSIQIFAPCRPHMWAVVAFAKAGGGPVNLDLIDDQGNLCVRLLGLKAGLSNPSEPYTATPPTTQTPLPQLINHITLESPQQDQRIAQAVQKFRAVYTPQSESLILKLMLRNLETLGLFVNSPAVIAQLKAANPDDYFYDRWLEKSIAFLLEADLLVPAGTGYRVTLPPEEDLDTLWRMWQQAKADWSANPNAAGYTTLMENMLKALPEIVRGDRPSTDILFPNSSMELMANTFRGNFIADLFNENLYDTIISYVQQRVAQDPNAEIRILEIGAGSGGATEGLLQRLEPYAANMRDYCFTDLSKAFLKRAQRRFGRQYPYLSTALFDCSKPFAEQDIDAGAYDLVIAANVLHATGDIRKTLAITKTAMRDNGLLCLIEISKTYVGAHLTFGMMTGWWLYEDAELRVPGSPALDGPGWNSVLLESGFNAVVFPGAASTELGQQVVVAQATPQTRPPQGPAPKRQAPVRPVAAKPQTDQITAAIVQHLMTSLMLDRDDIDVDGPFADMGLDSITGVELIESLNRALHTDLKTTCLFDFQTVNLLAQHLRNEYAPAQPETDTSQDLTELVIQELSQSLYLDRSEIDPNGSFEDIGLDSITGVQLIDSLNQRLGITLVTTCLFDHKTVNQLTAHIQALAEPTPPTPSGSPLSEGQKGLWALQKMTPELTAYNCPFAFRVFVDLDRQQFENACNDLLQSYPILTAVFDESNGVPRQVQRPDYRLKLDCRDVSDLTHEQIIDQVRQLSRIPFNLEDGPLLRFYLLEAGSNDTIILLNIHHIIFDGTTSFVLFKNLWQVYAARVRGEHLNLKAPTADYSDFVAWEQAMMSGPQGQAHLDFWKQKLAGPTPSLMLPTDYPRSAGADFTGDTFRVELEADLALPLKRWAQAQKVNPSTFFLGIFNLLLSRYSGNTDLLVGMPTKGRPERRFHDCMGYFINLMVIRTRLDAAQTFPDLLQDLQQELNQSLPHAVYPFPALVRELQLNPDQSQAPLFQVTFNYQNLIRPANTTPDGGGQVPYEVVDEVHQAGDHEFGFEIYELETRFLLHVHYRDDLFKPATIQRMMDHTIGLIEAVLANSKLPIGKLELLGRDERRRILTEWSGGKAPKITGLTHQWIEAQAKNTPDAPALMFPGQDDISYAQMASSAGQLANYLKSRGVQPGQIIGICLDRSPKAVISILAVFKLGGVYVPIDPKAPQEAVDHMIADAAIQTIIVDDAVARRALFKAKQGYELIHLDHDAKDIAKCAEDQPALQIQPTQIAYVIYTSGSTGTPKGVSVSYGAIAHHVAVIRDQYRIEAGDRILQFASLHVDTALEQILPGLTRGAALAIRDHELMTPRAFQSFLQEQPISIIDIPPRYLHELLLEWSHETTASPGRLRLVIVGGEAITPETAALWHRVAGGDVTLINAYGPTETTITSTTHRISPDDGAQRAVPIGKPLAGESAYILDNSGRPVPEGVVGELHIGGPTLARGYLNRPGPTAAVFTPNPFSGNGERLYKTGDLARHLPGMDGCIEFLGRRDHQVKIRGFRVELGEIEARLAELDGVTEAVVELIPSGEEQRLAAWLMADGTRVNSDFLQRSLRGKMPAHMIPQIFTFVDSWPLTPSGKVDRNALPAPGDITTSPAKQSVPPRDGVESQLAEIWSKILDLPWVGVYDNFFQLGGHSLLCVRLLAAIEREFGRRQSIAELIASPCIASQADWLRNQDSDLPRTPLVALKPNGAKEPFFCVHPVGGTVQCYLNLAARIDPARPFYGLQSPAIDGGEQPERLEDIAAEYLVAVRRLQPKGPYHLGGWSLGGAIAYEMAVQLHRAGESVAFLALLDSHTPQLVLEREQRVFDSIEQDKEIKLLYAFAYDLLGGQSLPQTIEDLPKEPAEMLDLITDYAIELDLLDHRDRAQVAQRFAVFKTNTLALNAWTPQPYPGDLALFRAREDAAHSDPTAGWGELVGGDLLIRNVPGNHYSIFNKTNISALALALNRSFPSGGSERDNFK